MSTLPTAVFTKKSMLTNLNGILYAGLSFLVIASLLLDGSRGYLAPVTMLVYAFIIGLVLLNWRANPMIRTCLVLCGTAIVFSIFASFFNDIYLSKFLVRAIMLVLAMVTLSSIKIPSRFINITSLVMLGVMAAYFVKSFGYSGTFYGANPLSSGYDPSNPNSMGLIAFFAFLLADRGGFMRIKTVRLAAIAATFIALFNYDARSSMLCLVLYLLYIGLKRLNRLYARKYVFSFVILFALIFPIAYVDSYNNSATPNNAPEILGKSVYSGRQNLWSEALGGQSAGSYLLGSNDITLLNSLPANSLHNMYIDIAYRLGIPFLILFLSTVYICIVKNESIGRKAYASILVVLVYGCFEASFESGIYQGMLMMLVFINSDQSAKAAVSTGSNRGIA